MLLMEELKKKYKSKKRLSKLYYDLRNNYWTHHMSIQRKKAKENLSVKKQIDRLMKTKEQLEKEEKDK